MKKIKLRDMDEVDELLAKADRCWKIAGIFLVFVLVCKIIVLILTICSY